MNNDFWEIVRLASKAPSGHNTQPWRFRISDDEITILPNYKVALPVVDPDNRELFISLGCAVENLFIASEHLGYKAQINSCYPKRITINLIRASGIQDNPLFAQIEKRQTNRDLYNGKRISEETLEKIKSIRKETKVQLYIFEKENAIAQTIKEYIKEGNKIQMNDKPFKTELLSWMRFNTKQVERTQDGLSYQVFGSPALPQCIAKPIVSMFLKPNPQNKSDIKKIDSSSHLVVFTACANTFKEWINSGRTLQRFLLKLTEEGISCAFMNQPCEVETLVPKLQSALSVNAEYPTILLRIGYAKPAPYSPRKEIEKILI
ncbi:nitroreductase [Bacteroides sp.]|uniref:Acg family FMN-binding oxidoreductase n=1 Tax=Bacteroides sp. TaxID=29523 RepID=UPI00260C9BCF|nr:nitroreductase [Bacteroides sp.]